MLHCRTATLPCLRAATLRGSTLRDASLRPQADSHPASGFEPGSLVDVSAESLDDLEAEFETKARLSFSFSVSRHFSLDFLHTTPHHTT